MINKICFDMDGTIADLYANPNWLPLLQAFDPTPYETAKVLVNMSLLARYIHKVQRMGVEVAIISWLSKESNAEYDKAVSDAKMRWLAQHLPSVQFDEIHIVPYGTPKSMFADKESILFDDELRNRQEWNEQGGYALPPELIFEIMKKVLENGERA